MSDRLFRILENEISKVNSHLPQKVIPLHLLLKMDHPQILTRDGEKTTLDNKEIESIAELFRESELKRISLPIYITRRRDMGKGTFAIGGSIHNIYIVRGVLDDSLPSFNIWKLKDHPVSERIIYNYQLSKIRSKFPTTTVIAFA